MPSILRQRRFALLFLARTASVLGSAFGPVALAFGVLALPGATATTLSLVTAAEALSMVVFMLLGGVIADRLPRFRVMMAADLGGALAWAGLAAMLITGWAPLWLMIATSAVAGLHSHWPTGSRSSSMTAWPPARPPGQRWRWPAASARPGSWWPYPSAPSKLSACSPPRPTRSSAPCSPTSSAPSALTTTRSARPATAKSSPSSGEHRRAKPRERKLAKEHRGLP